MARKKNIWDTIGGAISGAGGAASNAGKGGGSKGGGGTAAATGGVSSVASGVGVATGTATPTSSAAAGVSSVASGVSHQAAPTPTYSPYSPRSTTTVNLKPLVSSITDPATRALAPAAIRAGLKYEVNPSVLLGVVGTETDFGRAGSGKGYANLGDGSEDGAKSIRQAAKYLHDAGFHTNPEAAIEKLARGRKGFTQKVRKVAQGFTELDNAARKIEVAEGDTNVTGVGLMRNRHPADRPSARAAARAITQAGRIAEGDQSADNRNRRPMGGGHDAADAAEIRQRSRDQAAGQGLLTVDDLEDGRGSKPLQAARNAAALGRQATARVEGNPAGPRPRKVANRLERAAGKVSASVPDYVPQQYRSLIADASRKYDVPAGLLSALLQQESGFQAHIGSPAGAQGIAQFMPGTAASRGVNPDDPKSAIPGAAALLKENKDQFGSWELALAAYNAGPGAPGIAEGKIPPYAETQNYVKTIMANAGDTSDPAKSVPKQLIQRSYDVLGREATKAILNGGKIVKAPKGGVKETRFSGRYAGSQSVVRYLVGTKVKGDHGGTKNGEAPGVHTPDGDHYRADGYAQDINGTSPGENEPPYDQATLDTIVKNLRKAGAQPPPGDIKIGENWEGTVGTYSVQVLTNEGGTINHIHVGAHPTDGSGGGGAPSNLIPIKGTKLAVQPATETATGTAGTAATGGAAGLQSALDAVAGGSSGGGREAPAFAPTGVSIQSAAANYARSALRAASLQGEEDETGDPLYDAFRPRR